MQRHSLILLLCWSLGDTVRALPTSEVVLDTGARIQGDLLLRNPERVVIDLGVAVLSLPAERVQTIEESGNDAVRRQDHELYRELEGLPQRSVQENVTSSAEAVLSIHTPAGLGSGFGIHPDGYLVTNNHVIEGENRITVTLFEDNEKELRPVVFEQIRIVALNPLLDLALLKIEDLGDRRLPSLPLGDAAQLKQGDTVFGIGSPLGFDRTVSQGIVSLKNRLVDEQLYIQSTAQINPGNSGGPLFNLRGEVVGVTNMKIGSIGIEGLSFAIPSYVLKMFLNNVDAFAFDARNPNNGYRYNRPPAPVSTADNNRWGMTR